MNNGYGYLILITAFFTAVSQIMLNVSAEKTYDKKLREYLNPWVIGSYAILGLVLIANVWIMQFVQLKVAHVIAASTYVFVLVLSRVFLKEPLSWKKVLGNALIIAGIAVFIL